LSANFIKEEEVEAPVDRGDEVGGAVAVGREGWAEGLRKEAAVKHLRGRREGAREGGKEGGKGAS